MQSDAVAPQGAAAFACVFGKWSRVRPHKREAPVRAKQIKLKSRPVGMPTAENFELDETEVAAPGVGAPFWRSPCGDGRIQG